MDMQLYRRVKFAAEQAKRGSWPILAGWMEQTQSCVEAVQLYLDHCDKD